MTPQMCWYGCVLGVGTILWSMHGIETANARDDSWLAVIFGLGLVSGFGTIVFSIGQWIGG